MAKKKNRPSNARRRLNRREAIDYDYHLPVLLEETLELLVTEPDGVYIDGTLGGGGHLTKILEMTGESACILAFDKDPSAIAHCTEKFRGELSSESGRLRIINQSFDRACSIKEVQGKVQGILLDLGVSSKQLDNTSRGFSYRGDSRLDMRFASEGQTAEELVLAAKEDELERILRLYGEEPFAKRIARRIVERRRALPLFTTGDLRSIVEDSVPADILYKSLSRVFQAFRIAVNSELDVLESLLMCSLDLLTVGGRIVIMSYHSLEDRIVKEFFKEHSLPITAKNKYKAHDADLNTSTSVPKFKILTKKPIVPSEKEQLLNPRARSAKLRAAQRAN